MFVDSLFQPFRDPAYAVARIFLGLLFLCHGAQKLFGVLGGEQASSPMMWGAGGIEFFGGLGVALGLFASSAALICGAEMLAAYAMAHFPRGLVPIQNHGELALLYFIGFLIVTTHGAGRWSLDGYRKGVS